MVNWLDGFVELRKDWSTICDAVSATSVMPPPTISNTATMLATVGHGELTGVMGVSTGATVGVTSPALSPRCFTVGNSLDPASKRPSAVVGMASHTAVGATHRSVDLMGTSAVVCTANGSGPVRGMARSVMRALSSSLTWYTGVGTGPHGTANVPVTVAGLVSGTCS